MINLTKHQQEISENGYTIIEDIFNEDEIERLIDTINKADQSNPTFRKSSDLFAIRQFLKVVPEAASVIFNEKLNKAISDLFGADYFVVKSIYFDKPEQSNWFVAWHQDLTISVDRKADLPGYGNWTNKHNQFAVQPPLEILEDNFTIRIHLDDTDECNGALKVIPGSHNKGVHRQEQIDWSAEDIDVCNVKHGGIMIMRPLLMHASDRATNNEKRRVVHIEFSCAKLPDGIGWSELVS